MFGRGRKTGSQLHLYGKLPCAKDYLRLGMSEGVAGSIRSWLDRGFDQVAPGGGAYVPTPQNFVCSDGSSTVFVGALWPSHDQGGHRQFPFCLGLELKVKSVVRDGEADWSILDGHFRELHSIKRDLSAASSGAEVVSRARARRPAAPEPRSSGDSSEVTAALARDWFGGLFGDDAESRIGQLRDSLRSAAAARRSVRMPLSSSGSATSQVAAWWRVARIFGWPNVTEAGSVWFTDPVAVGGSTASTVWAAGALALELVPSLCGDSGFGVGSRDWTIVASPSVDELRTARLADSVDVWLRS